MMRGDDDDLVAYTRPSADILRLPPLPPRPVAAALSGGLLPFLEYLLRSGGRDPGGWQAAAARELTWILDHLVPLLAYGDAREAAALVVTLGKLLRRALADPRAITGTWEPRTNLWQAVLVIAGGLPSSIRKYLAIHQDKSGLGGAVDVDGPEPAAPAGEAEAVPGPPSPASLQLASLVTLAACRWVPPLSALVERVVQPLLQALQPGLCAGPGGGGGSGGSGGSADSGALTSNYLIATHMCWIPLLRACCDAHAAGMAAVASPGARAAAATPVAGGVATVGGGPAEASTASGDGGWRALLLEEAGVVPLLGWAIELAPGLEAANLGEPFRRSMLQSLLRCCHGVAALCRAAAAAEGAGAHERGPAPSSGGGSGAAGKGGVAAAVATGACGAADKGNGGNTGAGAAPPWRPELLRALGSQLRSHTLPVSAEAAEALAAAMDCWGGEEAHGAHGGGGCGGVARLDLTDAEADLLRLASAMPPPAEARRQLRACANPACANLDGDGEARLRLTPCAGCGEAAYCSRSCWEAHWRAGHRAACARRRLGGGG
ncbi:hypothetical protein GPECTOR_12g412 [Gonium pectorale]|uniref:phytol kinase n=1 Tax=Gonium pectorale TaxID=33097 RepID=A0A150GNP8_GONPE|nr:hypothetical protein GPECTOR_12g412 [Gonium pectorale]|eukprot:KXZ51449.1 hypothetical protein GPECTOR_12g412 [Gonium pectorale]